MRGILFALASTLDFHTNRLLAKQGRLTTKKRLLRNSSSRNPFFPPTDVAAKQATT